MPQQRTRPVSRRAQLNRAPAARNPDARRLTFEPACSALASLGAIATPASATSSAVTAIPAKALLTLVRRRCMQVTLRIGPSVTTHPRVKAAHPGHPASLGPETDSLCGDTGLRVRRERVDEEGCGRREREPWRGADDALRCSRHWSCWPCPRLSLAHPERPSYWPNPAADTSVSPPAGGKVPTARSLASAVTGQGPGEVRVVCKGVQGQQSLNLLESSLNFAQTNGFRLRPSQPKIVYGPKQAGWLRNVNRALAEKCAYHSVQTAVNHSRNNDRVVIMPGRYTEPLSRQARTDDPRCCPEPVPNAGERRHGAELRVSGDLSERPEPDLRPGPQDRGPAAGPPARQPPGDPGGGAGRVHALQPPDRGLGPQARGRDPRRRQELQVPGLARREAGR